jgi:putative component of membrane protein insertase Oxa1/YidC/SpoIIIJ protein YidD
MNRAMKQASVVVLYLSAAILASDGLLAQVVEWPAYASPVSEAWESADRAQVQHDDRRPLHPNNVAASLVLGLIVVYQHDAGEHSISRCPFYPSCSNFAAEAVRKHGFLLGSALFIDRNFFRENPMMFRHYPFIQRSAALLKLDDRYYLGEDVR